jgi:hypothetical protein
MKSVMLVIASVFVIGIVALALQAQKNDTAAHVQWVENALKDMQTIKVGMTRKDLLTVFTTEGGISSPRSRQYVYKKCPYFKVQVEFELSQPGDRLTESPDDRIIKISKPYLEGTIIG